MDRCIHYRKENVKHYYFDGEVKPNCMTCDGYGKDSKKHGWGCYSPRKDFKINGGDYEEKTARRVNF